jgi:hypothetical protein
MVAYGRGQLNTTMEVIYKIDEVTLEALSQSDCEHAEMMSALKLLKEDKEPI